LTDTGNAHVQGFITLAHNHFCPGSIAGTVVMWFFGFAVTAFVKPLLGGDQDLVQG